jgi:NADH-quinone oxidoreductase subunit C
MTAAEIVEVLQSAFPGAILAAFADDKHPRVHLEAGNWRAAAEFVLTDPRLKLDWLANLMCVVYDLWSFELRHSFAVKVFCGRNEPHVPSVVDLWPAANWHEREAFDLLGIVFDGHPDLRRILCADDWEGHPLRKDYVYPREYHGIPASVELDWQQKPDYP